MSTRIRLYALVTSLIAVACAGCADKKSPPAAQPVSQSMQGDRPDSPGQHSPSPDSQPSDGREAGRYAQYSQFCTPKDHVGSFLSTGTDFKQMRVKFTVMAFGEQGRSAGGCLVSETNDTAGFSVDDFSVKGFGYRKIPDAQAARIDQIIANLPPEPPQPLQDRRMLVSVPQGEGWKVHVYDRGNLPMEILELSILSGAGIGTRVVVIEPKHELDSTRANGGNEGAMALSPDGRTLVAGGSNNALKAWDVESLKPVDTFAATPKLGTVCLVFSPDGNYLAAAEWGKVVILNAKTGATVTTLKPAKDVGLGGLNFTPDGRFLIARWDNVVTYRVSDWQRVPRLPDTPNRDVRYFPSRDGKWAVIGSEDGNVVLWDVAARKVKATLETGHTRSAGAEFSPDQTQVAVVTEGPMNSEYHDHKHRIRVWDVKTARLVCELKPYDIVGPEYIEGLLWSPDGKYVIAATKPHGFFTSRELGVWNVAAGRQRGQFTGPPCNLTGMVLTPDGKTLIAGSQDNKIRLWDFEEGMKRIGAFEATLPALPQAPLRGAAASGPRG
jgi:WD40 repeat protein